MTTDDVLFRFRLRALALAEQPGNVRAACRVMGVPPRASTAGAHSRCASGLEMLRPRERGQPRMRNATPPFVEQRVVAGRWAKQDSARPNRGQAGAAEVRRYSTLRERRLRVLKRHGLNNRAKRLALVAVHAAPRGPVRSEPLGSAS